MTTIPIKLDDARRDRWGRYMVVPPGGDKPTGYTRVTTVAKTLDGGGGLAPWKAAMTAGGIIMRRGLRARWEALLAQYNGDPWYASEESKAACKKLVEDCAAVGGADDRKDMGVSLHTITALLDSGQTPTHLTEETERDLIAYSNGLRAAEIDIVPGMVEVTVVLDDWKVAGTFDRLVTVPGFEHPLIADLKTGADLQYSWQSIAVQLAAYSRANDIYVQGVARDGSQDERIPMPEVQQDYGLIMWLDAGSGKLELHLVDLEQGWYTFGMSMSCRKWRNAEVSLPLDNYLQDLNLVPLLEQSIKNVEAAKRGETMTTENFPSTPLIDDYQPSHTDRIREWLQARIEIVGKNPGARQELLATWPAKMPTLMSSTAHTPEDLLTIEYLLDGIEKYFDIPFGETKPTTDALGRLLHIFPNSTIITNNQEGTPS